MPSVRSLSTQRRLLRLRRLADPTNRQGGQSIVEFALLMPIMVVLMLAIVDFARIYTTMLSVESAAREAADFGTTLGAARWGVSELPGTEAEMQKRACVASSNLPDYEGGGATCTNPSFEYCMTPTEGGSCKYPPEPLDGCDDPARAEPCTVKVTLTYSFELFAPLNVEFFGVRFGLPDTVTFKRDSTFAMTDIDVSGP